MSSFSVVRSFSIKTEPRQIIQLSQGTGGGLGSIIIQDISGNGRFFPTFVDGSGNLSILNINSSYLPLVYENNSIGIGTYPDYNNYALDVSGSAFFSDTIRPKTITDYLGNTGPAGRVLASTSNGIEWILDSSAGTAIPVNELPDASAGSYFYPVFTDESGNAVDLFINSTNKPFIYRNRSLGIGTDPLYNLDVCGNVGIRQDLDVSGAIYAQGSTGSNYQILTSTGSSIEWRNFADLSGGLVDISDISASGTYYLTFVDSSGSTQQMFINGTLAPLIYKNRSIGIGLTPSDISYSLDVSGNARFSRTIKPTTINDVSDLSGTNGQVLISTGSGIQWKNLIDLSGGKVDISDISASGTYYLTFVDSSGSSEQMFINGTLAPLIYKNRSIGIGLTPSDISYSLDVSGSARFSQTIKPTTINDISDLSGTNGQVLISTGSGIQWKNLIDLSGGKVDISDISASGTYYLTFVDSSGSSEQMFINSFNTLVYENQRLGIGRSSPQGTLDVSGQTILRTPNVRIGVDAGLTNQGNDTIAIGTFAGQQDQSNNSIAIGRYAGSTNQSFSSIAIGWQAGRTNQNLASIAIGTAAGSFNQLAESIAIGNSAGLTSQSSGAIAIGAVAGVVYQGARAIALGYNAASDNQGVDSIAIGYQAGELDQSNNAIAIGTKAGDISQGYSSIAIGSYAGYQNQHEKTIVINASDVSLNTDTSNALFIKPIRSVATQSYVLGYDNSSGEVTYFTTPSGGGGAVEVSDNINDVSLYYFTFVDQSGNNIQKFYINDNSAPMIYNNKNIGIGKIPTHKLDISGDVGISGALFDSTDNSGTNNLFLKSTGTGIQWASVPGSGGLVDISDISASGTYYLTFVDSSGSTQQMFINSFNTLVYKNQRLGIRTSNPEAYLDVSGFTILRTEKVRIGVDAGLTNQQNDTIAIGNNAGQQDQNNYAIAIGINAGQTNQQASTIAVGGDAGQNNQQQFAIAIGLNAGQNTQGISSIAIGGAAGQGNQGTNSIAIGLQAGQTNQLTNSIAIGYQSGYNNQGTNSIAIGKRAGYENQHQNSIVINATDLSLNTDVSNALFIDPIRNITQSYVLGYDISRKEVTYFNTPSGITDISTIDISDISAANQTYYLTFVDGSGNAKTVFINGTEYEPLIYKNRSIGIGRDPSDNLYQLDVSGSARFSQTIKPTTINDVNDVSGNNGQVLVSTGSGIQWKNLIDLSGGKVDISDISASGTYYLTFVDSSGSSEQMYINSFNTLVYKNQRLGIRTSNPEAYLDVSGFTILRTEKVRIGVEAGLTNQQGNTIAIGNNAGQQDQNNYAIAIGTKTGQTSQGEYSVAIGFEAAITGQNDYGIAIGYQAGHNPQNNSAVAIGNQAGKFNQGTNSVAIGTEAGNDTQFRTAIAIGLKSGYNNQGTNAISLGEETGYQSQKIKAIAIGFKAGSNDQGINTVAIGAEAGHDQQGNYSIAIGTDAGKSNQSLGAEGISSSIAIGYQSGYCNQNFNAIAIGLNAGKTSQSNAAIAIGSSSGSYNQSESGIAIGSSAGSTNQGQQAIAIGQAAGISGQKKEAIAIGSTAGYWNQGTNAIAIGSFAGSTNQGTNAIAIGKYAGYENQHLNSIVINATDLSLNTDVSNALFINPIRNVTQNYVLGYDISRKEVTYFTKSADPNDTFSVNFNTVTSTIDLDVGPSSPSYYFPFPTSGAGASEPVDVSSLDFSMDPTGLSTAFSPLQYMYTVPVDCVLLGGVGYIMVCNKDPAGASGDISANISIERKPASDNFVNFDVTGTATSLTSTDVLIEDASDVSASKVRKFIIGEGSLNLNKGDLILLKVDLKNYDNSSCTVDNPTLNGTLYFRRFGSADISDSSLNNIVYTIGDQTIDGIKTFLQPIVGDLSGTAAFVDISDISASGTYYPTFVDGSGNNRQMFINSFNTLVYKDQKIGIGKSSPDSTLDVSGTGNITSNFSVNTNTFFVDASNNRVGIGTTNPTLNLDISSNTNSTQLKLISNDRTGLFFDNGKRWQFEAGGTNVGANNIGIVEAGIRSRLTCISGGNVGIGTNTPAYALDISGELQLTSRSGQIFNNRIQPQSESGGPSYLLLRRAYGTINSPLPITVSNQGLGQLQMQGYDGTDYRGGGYIASYTDGVQNELFQPSELRFGTTPDTSFNPVDRMFIKSSGNVGIGTNIPASTLDVSGTANVTGNFSVDISSLFVDASNNRVGIRTPTPQYPLEVNGQVLSRGYILTGNNEDLATLPSAGLYAMTANFIPGNQGFNSVVLTSRTDAQRPIIFATSNGTNPVERMRVNSDGNVGIGTTAPSRLLEVVGEGAGNPQVLIRSNNADTSKNAGLLFTGITNNIDANRKSTLILDPNGANGTGSDYLYFESRGDGASLISNLANAPLTFGTATLDRMTITGSGRVGVGTTSPDTTLSVGGSSGQMNFYTYNTTSIANFDTWVRVAQLTPTYDSTNLADRGIIDFNIALQSGGAVGVSKIRIIPNATIQAEWYSNNNSYVIQGVRISSSNSSTLKWLEIKTNVGSSVTNIFSCYISGSGFAPSEFTSSTGSSALNTFNFTDYNTLNNGSFLGTLAAGSYSILTNSTSRIKITDTGNVGIGTTTPGFTLDVSGTGNIQSSSGSAKLTFKKNVNDNSGGIGELIFIGGGTSATSAVISSVREGGAGSNQDRGGELIFSTKADGGSSNAVERMRINNAGLVDIAGNTLRLRTARPIASATATGVTGDICWDADYVYVCVATNTWKRSALSSWP